ncbi:MAG: glycosyltransferase family 9 protein [Chloroflexi bacterium]|nr:glycosyltransferase family 9 protein [Chloroflexota bacterium]
MTQRAEGAAARLPLAQSPEMSQALAELRAARAAGRLERTDLPRLAEWAAEAFLARYHADGGYLAEAIALLCEMATLDDAALAAPGVRGLFAFLVERLSDSFDPRYCALYDRLFAQVVDFCRRLPGGAALDQALRRFGLHSETELLARKARLQAPPAARAWERERLRKALLLSRVTLGADVAVTSPCLDKAKRAFPAAEMVLLAPAGTAALFRGDPRVRVRAVPYDRGGDLLARLNAWLDVLAAVDDELAGLAPEEYLVIDPDSRLTQLGIFPVVADESRYLFFESRGYQVDGVEPISALAAHWLEGALGPGPLAAPRVALAAEDLAAGRAWRARWAGAAPLVVVNLGVGGNERKRLGDAFERALLERLLAAGWRVLLAKGVGPEETARAEALAAALAAQGRAVADAATGDPGGAALVAWQGPLGAYAGLIAASDLYVGYDSAGQHIAAALGVPVIDIFVDRRAPMIAKRWRPTGPGPVEVVLADGPEAALAQVMRAARRLGPL